MLPESIAMHEAVEEVLQRNLRLILGAQFTQKEGERLIERAYNPALSEAENKKRVDRLITQIKQAAKAKEDASRYFENNGTLVGFRGQLYTSPDQFLKDETKGKSGTAYAAPPKSAKQLLKEQIRQRGK